MWRTTYRHDPEIGENVKRGALVVLPYLRYCPPPYGTGKVIQSYLVTYSYEARFVGPCYMILAFLGSITVLDISIPP